MPIKWDTAARRFRNADGSFVAAAKVRGATERIGSQAWREMEQLTRRLEAGTLRLETWQFRMEKLIRSGHIATGSIAHGGWKSVSRADRRAMEQRIEGELKALDNFARELEAGLEIDGRVYNRLRMYTRAMSATWERERRRDFAAHRKVKEERRLLHAAHNCADCLEYAAKSWQAPGTLPEISEDCACLSNCRCTFEYRYERTRKTD
jgi:hypothetical protein